MDGNNFENLLSVLAEAKSLLGNGESIMIIMTTIMGNGVDFMMGTNAWHGKAPSDEQMASALEQNLETLGDY
jgi:transketolase